MQLQVLWSPGLVEPRLQRSVEAQAHAPNLAWNGLDPVTFLAGRRLRAEIDIHRGIRELIAAANERRAPRAVLVKDRPQECGMCMRWHVP